MKKIYKLILSLILILTLSSCAYSEPDAKFTVTALGFSEEKNTVNAYLQAIDFATTGNGNINTFLTQGEGDNIPLALSNIKSKLSKAPSFEHCQIVFLSDGIEGELLKHTLDCLVRLGMSQRVTLAYTKNIEDALSSGKITSGNEMVSLIKQNAKEWGFGGHTALFEIKTAVLENGGNFALCHIETKNEEIKFSGLAEYKGSQKKKLLNLKQSQIYAKEQTGEK